MCCLSDMESIERSNAIKSKKNKLLTEFYITTDLSNEVLIDNICSILKWITSNSDFWPNLSYWRETLPKWFVSKFREPFTERELEDYRNLSYEEKLNLDINWDLDNWLYWLEPKNRAWYLWSHEIVMESALIITLSSEDDLFLLGAFNLLMTYCGAKEIDEIGSTYNRNWEYDSP